MNYSISRTRVFEASSRHAPLPAIQFQVNIEADPDVSVSQDAVCACIQEVSAAVTDGVLVMQRPEDETPIAGFSSLVMSLLRFVGDQADYLKVQPSREFRGYDVFVAYEAYETTLYAGELALEMLNAIWQSGGELAENAVTDLARMLDEFLDFALPRRLDPNSRLLMQAAHHLGIPCINLDQPPFECSSPDHVINNGYIQFGWGVCLRRCTGASPSGLFPDAVLQSIRDRALLMPLLQEAGIPVAGQDLEFTSRNQVRRAQRSAQRIGYPVTVRPRYSRTHENRFAEEHVFGPLQDDDQVERAVLHIREVLQTDVWVESFVTGSNYRFLVSGAEVVAVTRAAAPTLTGDGVHTISELASVRAGNSSNALQYRVWQTLAMGDAGELCRLQLAGLTLASVPEQGEQIALRAAASFDNGGTFEDVMNSMPAQFKTLALKAADVTGVSRHAGVCMTIRQLDGDTESPNCIVTSVLHGPDLQLPVEVQSGAPHPAASGLLRQLFPNGETGRIPIVSITGTNGKTTTSRMVAAILQQAGHKTGLACSDGVYLDGERVMDIDSAGAKGAMMVLVDSDMEAAVLETARGGMATTGIAFDQCDVGVCLNIAEDHLGLNAIDSLDAMAEHKRQVIERTVGVAVLNAEDPRCLAMRDHTRAKHIILVAKDANAPAIVRHCEAGGSAVVLDKAAVDGQLCIRDGSGIKVLLAVREIPASWDGLAFYNAENAMFAAAAALGLGLNGAEITAGLRGFGTSMQQTPGRLNVFEGLPFRVIFDYAHNAHGIKAFCEFTDQLSVSGRRILLMAAAGDRSAEEIAESAASVAGHFDYFICRDPYELRGRNAGDVPQLLKAGLVRHGVSEDSVETFTDKEAALLRALELSASGDLLVLFAGKYYSRAWETVKKYHASLQHDCPVH